MNETFTTQCPYCQTHFRLKHSQLSAARGSVRCGACLQVFNAASQLNKEAAAQAVTPAPTVIKAAPPTALQTSEKTLMIHDDMDLGDLDDLDDLDLDAELARLAQEEQQRNNVLSSERTQQDIRQENPAPLDDAFDDSRSVALNDWCDELLAHEPVAQLSSAKPEQANPAPSAEPAIPSSAAQFQVKQQPVHMEPLPMGGQLPSFNDGPLRLDWQPKKSPWKRWLAWAVLNSCTLLLLLGQYTYHNFAQLARHDTTRPWLAMVCPVINCQLPSKVDIQQIKSSNLIVRSHPEFSGALLVDAIIYNRAPFSQPFPLLEFTFSDQQGQPVAHRLFKPQEYLAGELAGQQQMPQQTPIHIALEILEPSGGVVNYSLNFVSPE